jgi:RHS repeat-associated protein
LGLVSRSKNFIYACFIFAFNSLFLLSKKFTENLATARLELKLILFNNIHAFLTEILKINNANINKALGFSFLEKLDCSVVFACFCYRKAHNRQVGYGLSVDGISKSGCFLKSACNRVNFSYDNEGNLISGDGLTISYNSFKQPTQISRGSNTFSFTYGANLERLKEVRNGLTTYEIDKAYEQSSDGSWKVYLDDVAIISHNSEDGHRIAYSHKDRLGSSITFTDHNGQVTGRRHYDAFGKPRAISGALMEPAHRPRQINFTDIAGISNAGITRRGFTDHRHLDEAELIHMNGRAYDYNLGRFLSVDPFIQSPTNSQSLNPYSYIMNNPLAGTDPTGYMGCAASKIDTVCANTDANHGGFAKPGTIPSGISTGGADKGNGAQQSQPQSQAGQQASVVDAGGQQNVASFKGADSGTNQGQVASATAITLAIPLKAAAIGTEAAAGESALGRILTANPILSAIAAMVYSPGLNEGEDEALAQMRSESKLDERKQPPSIVIGETQKRVEAMASLLRRTGVNVETILQDWPRDLLPSNNLEGSLEFNRLWINDKMDKNYTIYDVGLDPTRKNNRSIFYQLELNEISRRDYVNRLGVRLKE